MQTIPGPPETHGLFLVLGTLCFIMLLLWLALTRIDSGQLRRDLPRGLLLGLLVLFLIHVAINGVPTP